MITLDNCVETFKNNPQILKLSFFYERVNTKLWFFKMKTTKFWYIVEPIHFKTSWGQEFIIPSNFITDLSTVPKWAWGIFPPFGDFLFASIIHDYLYITKPCDKATADKEMLIWSKKLNNNTFLQRFDNVVRYLCVKYLGSKVWKRGIKNQFNP